MNLILLQTSDRAESHPSRYVVRDERAVHLRCVLRAACGEEFVAGIEDGPRGSARVVALDESAVALDFTATETAPSDPRIDLLIAMPRPKAWKRLLSQVAQFDVGRIVVVNAARVEKPYFATQYLEPAHFVPLLREGLMQAGRTRLPQITTEPLFRPFVEDRLAAWLGNTRGFLLDSTAKLTLGRALASAGPHDRIALAIGPDTGFVPFEREKLGGCGFTPVALGGATLRTDTATVAALGAVAAAFSERTA